MTRDELTRRILDTLNERDTTAPIFWSLRETYALLQDGQEVLAEEASFVKRTFVIPRRIGHTLYRLSGISDTLMAPTRLWLPDLKRRLQPVTLAELDARHERWWTISGDPWWWCPLNWDAFVIWPSPLAGGGWIEVDGYCWPSPLTDGGDTPELPFSQQDGLVQYAVAMGKLKQWDAAGLVETLKSFMQQVGRTQSQVGINQVQSRFWGRGMARNEEPGVWQP